MALIAQKELRNDVVAELRPVHKKQWVSGATLRQVWSGPAPERLEDDLGRLGADVVDPFA